MADVEKDFQLGVLAAIVIAVAVIGYFIWDEVENLSSSGGLSDWICNTFGLNCPVGTTPAPGSLGAVASAGVTNPVSSFFGTAPAGGTAPGSSGSVSGSFWTDTYNYFAGFGK